MKTGKLGRSPTHRRAMLKNLASSLLLSERDDDVNELGEPYPGYVGPNVPKVKGRVTTTVTKAKVVRRLVEKCITIARKGLEAEQAAEEFATGAARGSEEWRQWRNSDQWQKWNQAIAPGVTARRRCVQLLGNKYAVQVLFDKVAPRFTERDGGYTRVLRLANPRLGDAGPQAILEFVGKADRVSQKSEKPAFDDDEPAPQDEPDTSPAAAESVEEEAAADEAEESKAAE